MDLQANTPLLGGLSPARFMRTHWQRRPLLVRGALPGLLDEGRLPDRAQLLAMAAGDDVESRLVVQQARGRWDVRHGPFTRRALPALSQRAWTLLVQGVDLHHDGAHELMRAFSFIPHARLDDIMLSFATAGGGVGPHFDHYDVFLLQVKGRRVWRIGRQRDLSLRNDVPLKVLARFEPEDEYLLEPGDMLYLPPRYAHDGVALDECITCSVGFRTPTRAELAGALLQRLADDCADLPGAQLAYADAGQPATEDPGRIPPAFAVFAGDALQRVLADPGAVERCVGEYLSEPKHNVWFQPNAQRRRFGARSQVRLDRRTRMLHDTGHIYINGESWRAAGADARLMRSLADSRMLDASALRGASEAARALILQWHAQGWLHVE